VAPSERIRIRECGPRDGFQNEPNPILTENKLEIINALSETGLDWIEVTSFVNPKLVPQLADAEAVAAGLRHRPGLTYSSFAASQGGLDRAIAAGIKEVACALTAGDGLNRRNFNRDTAAMLEVVAALRERAVSGGVRISVTIGGAFGCPVDGVIAQGQVVSVARALHAMGFDEIGLGDTIGAANPRQVRRLFEQLVAEMPAIKWAGHFHDTRGTGLANILAAWEAGVAVFDSCIAGLGGCPFAPGSLGNVVTEDVANMFTEMGVETGLNVDALIAVSQLVEDRLGRRLHGRVTHADRFSNLGVGG